MKYIQGSFVSGYVKIKVIGPQPEHFLHHCAENGIMFWDVSKPNPNQCDAKIKLRDIQEIRRLRSRTKYKISFTNKYGLPFIKNRFLKKKPLLISLIISLLLLVAISNMIWQVKITGVPEELEKRIYSTLDSYGVHPGALKTNIDSPNQIQQMLIDEIPELLWVGVDLKGTTYHLEGVEKIIIKEEEEKGPRHLIANKNAVIKNMYVKKGQPKVKVNDYVEKGEVLVSGAIEIPNAENEEEQTELVAAEGDVMAITWYKAEVIVPLAMESEIVTGNVKSSYHFKIGKFTLPLWPWREEGFTNELKESEETQLRILRWELPMQFIEKRKLETMSKQTESTREEAIQRGILQAKEDLLLELGKDARILTEKVLHETIEHGKVNLSLYITVEENIATEDPITQGD